ncbi:hypothetical protein [Flavobacterium salmonis]|uniref:Uncharacterized protein n=1 Tax=Flavobacterium salmonis TaxID=2654844 RepID=A0A6V6YSH6_9FLAO|nr:hypothetical protein [Flavobacterium salmonis]CAD0002441.1 hypothetical protein FLAT13_01140 [Flavobacterium salmonis]
MNENVLRKERENVFKINHYYYLVDRCYSGIGKKYIPVRLLKRNNTLLTFLNLLDGDEFEISENNFYILKHRNLNLSEALAYKIGKYKPLKKNLFKNLKEPLYMINYDNESSYIIHVVCSRKNEFSNEFIHKKFFLEKKRIDLDSITTLEDLENESEEFKYVECLFEMFNKDFENTDKFVLEAFQKEK